MAHRLLFRRLSDARPDNRCLGVAAALLLAAAVGGCGKPNQANVLLRRENADLRREVDRLRQQQAADSAMIAALQAASPLAASSLPPDRLESLFTVTGLQFGRLTAAVDSDPARPGPDAVRVYLRPVDADGDTLKAAGSIRIEVGVEGSPDVLAQVQMPLSQARHQWIGQALLYEYVLDVPLPEGLNATHVRVRATFEDALTGRVIGPVDRKVSLAPADVLIQG